MKALRLKSQLTLVVASAFSSPLIHRHVLLLTVVFFSRHVLNELIETEKTYVQQLHDILRVRVGVDFIVTCTKLRGGLRL